MFPEEYKKRTAYRKQLLLPVGFLLASLWGNYPKISVSSTCFIGYHLKRSALIFIPAFDEHKQQTYGHEHPQQTDDLEPHIRADPDYWHKTEKSRP